MQRCSSNWTRLCVQKYLDCIHSLSSYFFWSPLLKWDWSLCHFFINILQDTDYWTELFKFQGIHKVPPKTINYKSKAINFQSNYFSTYSSNLTCFRMLLGVVKAAPQQITFQISFSLSNFLLSNDPKRKTKRYSFHLSWIYVALLHS